MQTDTGSGSGFAGVSASAHGGARLGGEEGRLGSCLFNEAPQDFPVLGSQPKEQDSIHLPHSEPA